MKMKLSDPITIGKCNCKTRIAMAPMTRSRTTQPGDIPNKMMAEYYAQRASAGLIISEATQISKQGQGYSFTPGIYSPEQIKGWQLVTNAVHSAGGCIFLQLWHVGRMSHSSFHNGGLPVAPSALNPDAKVWVVDDKGVGSMVDCPTPRALSTQEIKNIINDFKVGAQNAMLAGFDGVEIHGANGYLIDEFLRTTSNTRTDEYGGNIRNRIRFMEEVATTVVEAIGSERVGIRLSPYITARNMNCPEIIESILNAATMLNDLEIAYLHLSEADWDDAPEVPTSFRHNLRNVFKGALIVAGRYDQNKAEQLIGDGLTDMVAFGRPFIANPDLPARFALGLPLANFDPHTLFGGNEKGYTDYRVHAEQHLQK